MADLKISQLTSATLPLAGTEVLPIVQSSSTKKVATDDLTVKNLRSNATNGILQIAGPAASSTRTMTVPDANFTAARTDAAQSFTGNQTLSNGNLVLGASGKGVTYGGVTLLWTSTDVALNGSANYLVGTTSFINGNDGTNDGVSLGYFGRLVASADQDRAMELRRRTTNGTIARFYRDTSLVGSISVTTTDTTYNTSSDYRLKTFVSKVSDSGTRLDALNPVEFEWKADKKRSRGFFAHEFQTVYANSVTGGKDDVDAEGKPVYQSMQASSSEVMADLVAEIQSLRKRIAALEAA